MRAFRYQVTLLGLVFLLVSINTPVGATSPGKKNNEPGHPNLIIVTLDTTRADHIGCLGGNPDATPTIDRLASEGTLFTEAHSHVPLTLPSHSVIMTGDLPSTLNLRVNGLKLGTSYPTLASILRNRGYWTGAVVASVILERSRGLARGFDHYDDRMTMTPRTGGSPEERRGGDVTSSALKLALKIDKPFFLWVHYYDPHYEYRPPMPYAKKFSEKPYDGEIAYMDHCLKGLLDGLHKKGLLQNTIIAVVADHGEGLMEHGERQHGVFLYEYALHVPLIIKWPGHIKKGLRANSLCGLEDIAPTLLELMDIKAPPMDGRSLKPLLDGKKLSPKGIYIESYHGFFNYGWAPLRGWMDNKYKYIDAPRPELYEWRVSETKNLYKPGSEIVKSMERELAEYPEAQIEERREMVELLKDPSNAETLKKLMSLGYLSGAGGATVDGQVLLDPKDAIDIENLMKEARDDMDAGKREEGMNTLIAILKRNPQNVPALSMLGLAYLRLGKNRQAEACFREEIRLKPQMHSAHLNLGTVCKNTGRLQEAEKEYRAALAISPRFPEAIANLADTLVRMSRSKEAGDLLRKALKADLESSDIYFELGLIEAEAGKLDKARFYFSKALSMNPANDQAAANIGKAAYQQGRIGEAITSFKRAARIAPGKAEYLATLGSLYLQSQNDPETALHYYRKAISVDPYGSQAKSLRSIVREIEQMLSRGQGTGAEP